MRINALVALKTCMVRLPLWQFMSTENAQGQTPFDVLFQESGLFSQELILARINAGTKDCESDKREYLFAVFVSQ